MNKQIFLMLLMLLAIAISTAGLSGCNESDGDTPDGDSPDGDAPDGDTPDGDAPDGDAPDGDAPDGDTPDGDAPDGDAPDGDAPHWPDCDLSASTQAITFIHINDLHSEYTPDPAFDNESPVSRLRGYFEQVKAEQPFTLFTDGGDDHEKGSVAEPLSDGYSTTEIVHAMGFDVRVIGNHDFAWGPEEVMAFSRDPHALVLASNTTYDGPNPEDWWAVSYGERKVGCVTIGFFGMAPKPYNANNQSYAGDYYPGGDFHTDHDYPAVAAAIVQAHRADVDLMVMVSHLGNGTDADIAAAVPGIDVILGGHSHTTLYQEDRVGETVIVQAGSNALWAAHLDLTVDLENGGVADYNYSLNMNMSGTMPVDETVQTAVETTMLEYAPEANDPVAMVVANRNEAQVAAITAQAAVETLSADAAVVIVDEVWATWSSGPLTQQKMLNTYKIERQPAGSPGFNSFYTVSLSGDQLQAIRDHLDDGYACVVPGDIEAGTTYTLAIQKMLAFNPDLYLPVGTVMSEPVFAMEAWELLDTYGRARTQAGLYIDVEEALMAL